MCGTSVRQIFADPDYSFHHHLVGLNIMVSIILLLLRGPSPQSESPFPDPESTTTAHSLPPFTLAGHHCYLPTPPYPPLCPRSTSCIVVHLRCAAVVEGEWEFASNAELLRTATPLPSCCCPLTLNFKRIGWRALDQKLFRGLLALAKNTWLCIQ